MYSKCVCNNFVVPVSNFMQPVVAPYDPFTEETIDSLAEYGKRIQLPADFPSVTVTYDSLDVYNLVRAIIVNTGNTSVKIDIFKDGNQIGNIHLPPNNQFYSSINDQRYNGIGNFMVTLSCENPWNEPDCTARGAIGLAG